MSEFKMERKNGILFFVSSVLLWLALPTRTKCKIWHNEISRNENNSSRGLNAGASTLLIISGRREKKKRKRNTKRNRKRTTGIMVCRSKIQATGKGSRSEERKRTRGRDSVGGWEIERVESAFTIGLWRVCQAAVSIITVSLRSVSVLRW